MNAMVLAEAKEDRERRMTRRDATSERSICDLYPEETSETCGVEIFILELWHPQTCREA